MSFWMILDDSVASDELLAGVGTAALAAFLAELVTHRPAISWTVRCTTAASSAPTPTSPTR